MEKLLTRYLLRGMYSRFRLVSYLIFGLNGLLVFLWFYSDKLSIPGRLLPIGRLHPMVLHLPIGFFVMAVVVLILKDQFKAKQFQRTLQLTFTLTSLSLVITALAGIILSREGGYDTKILDGHLNSGVLLSIISAVISGTVFHKKVSITQYGLTGIGFALLIVTGHFGATLTHGDNYLSGGSNDSNTAESQQSDSITFFAKAILPVLEKKCISCHNPKKKKGELILTNQADLLKGGENGPVLDLRNPSESEFLKRIYLELSHDDHMPPSGKPQLTVSEVQLLEKWIGKGADFATQWKDIAKNDSLIALATQVQSAYEKKRVDKVYDFDFVSGNTIESLNSPFRTVSQLSTESPALKAGFYLSQYFNPNDLKSLKDIKPQLVELNLACMPIADNDISQILDFENLETLNLNNTSVTDEGLAKLSSLDKLQKLSLAGTKVTASGLGNLREFESLKEVFVWNTKVTMADLKKLEVTFPGINFSVGYQPSEAEILRLTPPILKNESFLLKAGETVQLKHNLPGTEIRYTLDGTDPDSIKSIIYSEPIKILRHSTLKTLATKTGWLKSSTLEYTFFVEGLKPSQTQLLSETNKDYKAKGAVSLADNLIGDPDNFRDGNWLGFRGSDMISQFSFNKNKPTELALIYNRNIGSYLMPPEIVEIWGGDNTKTLRLIGQIIPKQPSTYSPNKNESVSYQFTESFSVIKVIAKPVSKLPSWHSGKGEKGWLMVSEIIFN